MSRRLLRARAPCGCGRQRREEKMARQFIDCREFPSDSKCTIAISADSQEELLEAAVQHAVAVHGAKDTLEFREEVRRSMHAGTPPLKVA
ncbi:DUF1059 domain-containing protein [Agrobacterium fabrum]|uniref:DUF1059 domain-containing protein n=2 Tax=Rhizobium/Agrobacterium group TaxID=227290 RepID=Q7CX28_AGRFC|nr:hypothetical protein Atu2432 [Agrobacterium fabrum str. C58]KJX87567.1 hypothetical protein SY94_2281 [Agrobacterium tumefaciens]QRM58350.1 DUF1059 domain-containing protein [Agrobacterium fabrum]TRB29116.1 DUF1059 domain-containing protein [Agrobacterium fabrum]